MQTKSKSLVVELGLLCLLALLWGSSYLFSKVVVAEIPPITMVALRVSLAAAFLLAVMAFRGERLPRDRRTWRMLYIQAIFNSIAAWTVLAWALQHMDSGLASVLNSTAPIFIFFITYFFTNHEATSGLKLLGACLGLAGVVLIVGVDALGGIGQSTLAQLAALFGALLYAGASIYGKRLSHLSSIVTAAGTMLVASLTLVPLSLIFEAPWTLAPSAQTLAAMVVLGVFCTGVALMLYFRLLQTLGSLGVASQAYLRAGIGVILGVMLLGEEITLVIGFGLLAAILGVAAINMPPGMFKRRG